MNNEDMKKVAIKASVLALISMALMLHRSATKHVMITDAAEVSTGGTSTSSEYELTMSTNMPDGKENCLIIPISKNISADDIVLEDRYTSHELRIYIDGSEDNYYKDNPIMTDVDIIESASCTEQTGSNKAFLNFELDGLYANESSLMESGAIEVRFFKPAEKYSHIVVVDPEYGVTGKDITYETALLLKDMAESDSENDVKFYYTRGENELVDHELALTLVKETGADLFVQMEIAPSDGTMENGMTAYYNDSFFNRRLTNAGFADIILRNCATKTGVEALGILPMEEGDIMLKESKVPSVRMITGYINGAGDIDRLSDKNFEKHVAEGIYSGVLEAFEVMK